MVKTSWLLPPDYATIPRQIYRDVAERQIIDGLDKREIMRETTRQLFLGAAKQQTGASPVTAVTIGSGSTALVWAETLGAWGALRNCLGICVLLLLGPTRFSPEFGVAAAPWTSCCDSSSDIASAVHLSYGYVRCQAGRRPLYSTTAAARSSKGPEVLRIAPG